MRNSEKKNMKKKDYEVETKEVQIKDIHITKQLFIYQNKVILYIFIIVYCFNNKYIIPLQINIKF